MREDQHSVHVEREESLCSSVRQLSRSVTRLYNKHMPKVIVERLRVPGDPSTAFKVEVQIRVTQVAVLEALWDLSWCAAGSEAPGVSQVELATYLGVDTSTMCRNMRVLVKENGWVQEVPSPSLRGKLLSLSPAGRTALLEARPQMEHIDQELNHLMTERSINVPVFRSNLDTVLDVLEKMAS